jgi:hypothetical protein
MYLILVKYFYYFYYLKKNKKFKFFILIDLIFFLMQKYFRLLVLRKKILKYKNLLNKIKDERLNQQRVSYLTKLDFFLKNKLSEYNEFIITFLPSQLLPMGNRKKFYNLINKKFKRFFLIIKKKLNKKFFFFYLVQLFRKIKFLFVKSDAFLNKKTFLFDFFSLLSLETKYSSLLQVYKQHVKKDNFLRNRFLSFFNMISFFLYRIDYYLSKIFSFISIVKIRDFIFKCGIFINNKKIQTIHVFLSKYDLVQLPKHFFYGIHNFYIFSLKSYFDFICNSSYKKHINVKFLYYVTLFKNIKKKVLSGFYLSHFKKKNERILIPYLSLLDGIFSFFFKQKKSLFSSFYNFDSLNHLKDQYKVQYQFPFFLNTKKKDLFFNMKPGNLCNISYSIKKTSQLSKDNLFNFTNISNFIDLYFFFFKYRIIYYYCKNNKFIVSPNVVIRLVEEQKKLFYYFSILFHINITQLI